jgi:hypothetical protein
MSNGTNVHSQVSKIHQRDDKTVEVHVQTNSFNPGQEVEVSGYLIQGSTYVSFNVKKYIPLDPTDPRVLHVQLPPMDLNEEEVTIITRVAEVWPTILKKDPDAEYVGKGLKAVWTAHYPLGKAPRGQAAAPQSNEGSEPPASQQS